MRSMGRRNSSSSTRQLTMLLRPSAGPTKKQKNGDRQGMSKAIQHALTITNFRLIDQCRWRSIVKLATMGGGDSHCVKKGPLFVWRLSVFLVFF